MIPCCEQTNRLYNEMLLLKVMLLKRKFWFIIYYRAIFVGYDNTTLSRLSKSLLCTTES